MYTTLYFTTLHCRRRLISLNYIASPCCFLQPRSTLRSCIVCRARAFTTKLSLSSPHTLASFRFGGATIVSFILNVGLARVAWPTAAIPLPPPAYPPVCYCCQSYRETERRLARRLAVPAERVYCKLPRQRQKVPPAVTASVHPVRSRRTAVTPPGLELAIRWDPNYWIMAETARATLAGPDAHMGSACAEPLQLHAQGAESVTRRPYAPITHHADLLR